MDWVPNYVKRINGSSNSLRNDLRIAYRYAWDNSHDPQTKNGALLLFNGEIISMGTNKFPGNVIVTPERLSDRVEKLKRIEHAERNVIFNHLRNPLTYVNLGRIGNLEMVVPWYSCYDCGRAIIGVGIKTVIGHKDTFERTPDRWRENIAETLEMMHEAGIDMKVYMGAIGDVDAMLNGEVWHP